MNQLKTSALALVLLCGFFQQSALSGEARDQDPFSFIRKTDLGKFPVHLRAKYHRELTLLMVKLESSEKYPEYTPSRFSQLQLIDLLSNALIKESIASDSQSNACLFGGWVSRRNGSCSRPWGSASKALAESMDVPSYNSEYFCGADNLFRCNPLMFGPGLDQELVGSEFPNLNGKRNNTDPYSKGICIDVSKGYSGLSERCQAASEKLDQVRKQKGMPAWRESSFFDQQKAQDFSKLQAFVADKCAQNAERLNKDNMCTSLNQSLGMTAAAVIAGNIDGISPEELFPGCENYKVDALPKCNEEVNSEFNPMLEAMEELRQNHKCSFVGIQAIDGDSLSISFDNPEPNCRSSVAGALRTTGFGHQGEQNFSFYFVGADKQQLGRIEARVSKEMSKEAIMAALISGANQDAFNRFCNNSVCPRSENPTLKNLYGALDQLKEKENCNIGSAHAVDYATESSGIYEHSSCGLSIEGELGSNGLSGDQGKSTKVSITLRDKKGAFLTQAHIEISPDMSAEEIMKLIPGDEISKACVHSNVADKTDNDSAAADLGMAANAFVPSFWKDKRAAIRNLAQAQDPPLENFRVEVDEYGNLKLYGSDVMRILAMRTGIDGLLGGGRFNYVGSEAMGYVQIEGAPPSAAIETITHRKGITLTSEQRSILEDVGSAQALRDISVSSDGVFSFATIDPGGEGALFKTGEEYNGHRVLVTAESEEKLYNGLVSAPKREYKLIPLASGDMSRDIASGCMPEGEYISVMPNQPQCCSGLTLKPPAEGVTGIAGTCERAAGPQ